MVHEGSNKAGRFLEVSIYAEGGHKGVLWLPESQFGRGWRRFTGKLHLMLVNPNGKSVAEVAKSRLAPSTQISPSKHTGVGVLAGCSKTRSFVEVLQSKPCPKLKDRSRGEAAKGGVVKRPAVEEARSAMAAASVRKTRGISVQGWVNHLLGIF